MSPIGRYGPPLALMAVIFFLSAQPDLNSGLGLLDLIGRKLIHALEFGLLFWLWLRAFGYEHAGVAAGIAIVYAASDEYHQSFVEGRVASPVDLVIDTTGVAVAWAATRILRRRSPRLAE